MNRKHADAARTEVWFKKGMYRTDVRTGETVFALPQPTGAYEVVLEGFSEQGPLRVLMSPEASGWVARLALAPGWFFYRFCIDGQARYDRSAGKLKSADGQAWSLALISGIRAAQSPTGSA